jgi:hypothetical protein
VPALPGAADGDQPVRRVTLPRAMSRVHRPEPLIGATEGDGGDRFGDPADNGLGVRLPLPRPRTATGAASTPDHGPQYRFAERAGRGTPGGDPLVRRSATTNDPDRGIDRVDHRNDGPNGLSRGQADARTTPTPPTRLRPRRNGELAPSGHDQSDHGPTDPRTDRHDWRDDPDGTGSNAVRRVAAARIGADRSEVAPPRLVRRAAEDAGTPDVRHEGTRVSVRPPTDAPAAATSRVPTPTRRHNSIVRHGADVLRRALADPTSPSPSPAGGADGLPVAPAARVAPDSPAPGGDPAVPPAATHAAGRPRSDAGAALAERFMTELSHAVRSQPAPLPTTLRPMADQIAGRRAVMLSTDTASRRALRSVGKRAATVGDTIHVDVAASQLVAPSPRITAVVAHELTHVAHPSPAPRFFDDVDDSPEERRAEAIARMMARAPLAPAASTLAAPHTPARPAAAGSAGRDVIRRSPASGSTPGTIRADELAASITHTSPPDTVRRQHTVAAPARPQAPAPASPPTAPSAPSTAPPTPAPAAPAGVSTDAIADRDEEFRTLLERNLDVVLRRVEDHILIDIERRGGRAWRGF